MFVLSQVWFFIEDEQPLRTFICLDGMLVIVAGQRVYSSGNVEVSLADSDIILCCNVPIYWMVWSIDEMADSCSPLNFYNLCSTKRLLRHFQLSLFSNLDIFFFRFSISSLIYLSPCLVSEEILIMLSLSSLKICSISHILCPSSSILQTFQLSSPSSEACLVQQILILVSNSCTIKVNIFKPF